MSLQRAKLVIRGFLASAAHCSGILSAGQKQPKILMYHRVTSPEACGHVLQPGMYVRPETFAMQMRYLATQANVVPLDTLVADILLQKPTPQKTVAITFDDGWRDNYDSAFPILKEHGLPATIFLATGFINSTRTLWSDALPQALSSIRDEAAKREALRNACVRVSNQQQLLVEAESVLTASHQSFTPAVDSFVNRMKQIPLAERNHFIAELSEIAGIQDRAPRAFLSWEECQAMSTAGISFGSHTHRHEPLDLLSNDEIQAELTESFQALDSHRVSTSSVFCYPEGRYSPLSQNLLRTCPSVRSALSVAHGSDLSQLPPLLGRIGIHQDISSSPALFALRVWG